MKPKMRSKLGGGDRFKGRGALSAGEYKLSLNDGYAGRRVARSLCAVR